MKTFNATQHPSGLKRSLIAFFTGIAFVAGVCSCHDGILEEVSQPRLVAQASLGNSRVTSASSSTAITEITFTATAAVAYCYGEDIRFSGTIQNRVTKTSDAKGEVHYTRSFATKDMTAVGVTTNTEFDVLGGAEMFAVKDPVLSATGTLNVAGSLSESDILIHEGTLVFQSLEDGSKLVARHIIRKVPGQDVPVSKWECQGD
jgi:hypothetical protein